MRKGGDGARDEKRRRERGKEGEGGRRKEGRETSREEVRGRGKSTVLDFGWLQL